MDPDDWEPFQYGLIRRTTIPNNFIRNQSAIWCCDVQEGNMSVQCVFRRSAEPIKFRIPCKTGFAQFIIGSGNDDHAEGAWKLLKDWKVLDIEFYENVEVVMAFEAERKTKKGAQKLISSEVREHADLWVVFVSGFSNKLLRQLASLAESSSVCLAQRPNHADHAMQSDRRAYGEADTPMLATTSEHCKESSDMATNHDARRRNRMESDGRCHLLELPPEFADNEDSDLPIFTPQPRRRFKKELAWAERPWQFYGLTQTCRQLRAEHRPIWIQNLHIRLDVWQLDIFCQTFLLSAAEHTHRPKLIEIPWDGSSTYHAPELLSWLHFRTRHTFTSIAFVPEVVVEGGMPREEKCDYCVDMEESGRCRCCHDYDTSDCECDDPDMGYFEWIQGKEAEIEYASTVKVLLDNRNATWPKAIDDGAIIGCTFTSHCGSLLIFRIRYKDTFYHYVSDMQGAWDVLKSWGVFDLLRQNNMVFKLVFDKKQTAQMGDRKVTNTITRKCISVLVEKLREYLQIDSCRSQAFFKVREAVAESLLSARMQTIAAKKLGPRFVKTVTVTT
ncbi:hypothetical protein EK21DRAFT_92751 [Setomelanomma holmii]|uniref:Uncharacterized protein n=1 Tax=Setomelanomma holmii TaxID=210430 RepID=A0A9P4LIA4_9PLEO|nr:hypothetical protein EK21DRAFT_92751 [Setomelanomma holmii]